MLSHINDDNQPEMVDVSKKEVTLRSATAAADVTLGKEILSHLQDGDIVSKKGPVFQTAIIAGTMAVKKTAELIPFCHPLAIENCKLTIDVLDDETIHIRCQVSLHHKTGVEMEALTGVSVAALTVYDMCKAMSKAIVIRETRLLEKQGGKSDFSLQ